MTATTAPARHRPTTRRPGPAAVRLLRLELRHNAMLWMLPVAIALFWLTTYRKAMAMPPMWNMRTASLQTGALVSFALPVVGAAAWMGSRESRRRTADLVAITARPRWARQLATWAATTGWAVLGYLACVAVLYGVTAQQATWGGPLWWPVAVDAASLAALSAAGFAAGTLSPSRFTAPLAAVAAFIVLALSTQLINGTRSYWLISPIVNGPWDIGNRAGVATFYPFLPDLAIAQVMFLTGLAVAILGALALPPGPGRRWVRRPAAAVTAAGLLAAGTAVALAGTARLDAHGMLAIPALHDAASDRPLRYTPVCSHTPIPVCLNPAYASYLPATAAALDPVLTEIAGLPGAPARISQAAAIYTQGTGNTVSVTMAGPTLSGVPPVYHLLLPDQGDGPAYTTSELADSVRANAGPGILASDVDGSRSASPAQHAVLAALLITAGLPPQGVPAGVMPIGNGAAGTSPRRCRAAGARCPTLWSSRAARVVSEPAPGAIPGSPAYAAARRFAALPAATRHAWLVDHLAALRAGQITLARLP